MAPRCVNKTGVQINDGEVVYVIGAQGNRPSVALAKADAYPTSNVIGMATQNIPNNEEGYVTIAGLVRGYNTSGFTEGDTLYLSASTTGALTKTPPASPNFLVHVGKAMNSTSNGSVLVHPQIPIGLDKSLSGNSDLYSPSEKAIRSYVGHDTTKEFTGFDNPGGVVSTYNKANRTVTLTGTFKLYWRGREVTSVTSGWTSSAHANDADPHFLFYDGDTDTFVWQTTPWTFDKAQIAYVSGTTFGIRETHGLMAWQTHEELHKVQGTYLDPAAGGGDIGAIIIGSTTAANRRPTVAATLVRDEDLPTTINSLPAGTYTQMYLAGAGATNTFATGATDIVPLSGNNPYYNLNTAGTWSQALMTNNTYMCVFLVASPVMADADSQLYRYLWVQGQSIGTLAQMQGVTFNQLSLGTLTSLFTEFVPIGKIIIQYTSGNWKIVQSEKLIGSRAGFTSVVGTGLSTVSVSAPLTGDGTVSNPVAIPVASGTADGYLAASDWTRFDSAATPTGPLVKYGQGAAASFAGTAGTAVGYYSAGWITSGENWVSIGSQSGVGGASGDEWVMIGYGCVGKDRAVVVGSRASSNADGVAIGWYSNPGTETVAIGRYAGYNTALGPNSYSVFIGSEAGRQGGDGVKIGYRSGYGSSNLTSNNIYIGAYSGRFNSLPNLFVLDSFDRTSEADMQAGALLVGQMASSPSSQTFKINAAVSVTSSTASTSTTTGALVVTGGLGVGGSIFSGSQSISGTLAQSNTMSGATTTLGVNLATVFQNTAGSPRALISVGTSNPSGASSANVTGVDGRADLSGNATFFTTGTLTGVSASVRVNSGTASGTLATAYGLTSGIQNQNATVTLTNATSVYVASPVSTGAITANYGVYIENQKPTGVGTGYGLYIASQTAGSYALFQAGSGLVKFSDTTASTSSTTGAVVVTGGLGVGGAGNFGGALTGTTLKSSTYTVATLPTGSIGMRAMVTDATAPAFLAAVVGGGASIVPVYHDGVSWKVG